MPSVNKVFILGALGRDPETRFTNTNLQITSFSVATSTFRKGEDGERKEETEWHRITTIGRTAEVAQTYLSKGSKVFIEGHLRTRKWENKEGKTQYSTEIVADNLQLLDKKSDRPGQPGQAKQAPAEEPYTGNPEDIPF
jgi:single-strand binding protein